MDDIRRSDSYGVRRAINELLSIFDSQWSNGMLPQIRFMEGQWSYRPGPDDWGVTADITGPTLQRTSGITQPPVVGVCAREVYSRLDQAARRRHLTEFVRIARGLQAYHDWLLRERDPLDEKLLVCLHPWETGTDNSPAFDPLVESTRRFVEESGLAVDMFGRGDTVHVKSDQRPTDRDYYAYFGLLSLFRKHNYDQRAIIDETPFLLQDVLFNSLFVASLLALAELQQQLSEVKARSELGDLAAANRKLAAEVAGAIWGRMWDEESGFFYSYDLRDRRALRTPTVSGFTPLMAGIATPVQAERLIAHLLDPAQFWTDVPVPSTGLSSPAFNPARYWSGPTWPVTNWLVVRGLHERGSGVAAELRRRTLAMIEEGLGPDITRRAAEAVMEQNSVRDRFTTPSTRQYQHAWLWDSAIVALGWPEVIDRPQPEHEQSASAPGFWEYYDPFTGAPLGAKQMTWTASLYLELSRER